MVTFIFILLRISPGDPTLKFVSPQLNPELAQRVSQSFNLDKSIFVQYIYFVKNLLTGNFGLSYNYRQPVMTVISSYFLFTLLFATASFIIQILFSYWLVKISVRKKGSIIDKTFSKLSLILFATPSFVLGLILIYIFAIRLDWLPTSGIKSIYSENFNLIENILDILKHIILPLITLSAAGVAVFYKYLRDSVEDIYNQPFVINLRALGLSEREIFSKHVIPNSLRPLISIAGIEFGILLGGALITEVIFSLPGMGRLTVNAIFNRDFPLVIGCSFIAGLMMILTNLAADLIKIKIDKRLIKDLLQ